MSKDKSTKKSTITTAPATPAKRGPGRPRKSAAKVAKHRQAKARILVAGDIEIKKPTAGTKAAPTKTVPIIPKSVEKLAAAKSLAPKRPLGRPAIKKPAVDVHQLEKSLKEAVDARDAKEKTITELEIELKDARTENKLLTRTVDRLRLTIDELRAEKNVKSNWLRRLLRRA